MKHIIKGFILRLGVFLLLWCVWPLCQANIHVPLLTLPEAEQLAVANEPSLQSLQVGSDALQQQAIANDQLPDPKLMMGAVNVPTNSFSFTQEDMTMVEVGVEQSFPAGHSLKAKSQQTQSLALVEQDRQLAQQKLIIQKVQDGWLELYYWLHAAKIVQADRALLKQSVKAEASRYAAGKVTQQAVLQTQLELSNLIDEQAQIQQQIAQWQAELGRWIGQTQAERPLAKQLPSWTMSALPNLQQRLLNHPLLKMDAATIQAAREGVAWSKEQYKPGFDVDVGYGVRQGHDAVGMRRSDFVGAQVKVDLPIFTKRRQDRRLQASEDELTRAELDRQAHYRDLSRDLISQYATWQTLNTRAQQYQRHVLPETKQNTKAALRAYRSASTDLTTVLRANSMALKTQLQYLRIQVDHAKAEAALRYLAGE